MESPNDTENRVQPRRISPGWLAAFVVGLVVIVLVVYAVVSGPAAPEIGEPVPGFDIAAIGGGSMDLESHRGKVVVINVFASTCPPCREEAPDIEQTWRVYKDRGVQFFGIAYKDVASQVQAFLEEFDVTYPYGVESNNRTARSLGVTGVPETFVVDQEGRLFYHYIGPVSRAELSSRLDLLLGE
jgi:peroxiredoxin